MEARRKAHNKPINTVTRLLSPGMKKNNMAAQYILLVFKVLPLITNVEHLFRQTNSYVEKGFYKSLKSRSPFRFKLAISVNLRNF